MASAIEVHPIYGLYHFELAGYLPAIFMTVFGVLFAHHVYRIYRSKAWYAVPFAAGAACK
jgi:hypothetical protein